MKKITAIFFLILFSFNWFGYRWMYDYMQKEANEQLEASLDSKSFDESQLVEIKIALHLPYQTTWGNYERYDGQIDLNGTLYKYVKRKVANDTLYLMCIPNTREMHLETAKNDFFKISNDLIQNSNTQKNATSKTVSKDFQTVYNQTSFGINIASPFTGHEIAWLPEGEIHLLSVILLSPEQPPDLARA